MRRNTPDDLVSPLSAYRTPQLLFGPFSPPQPVINAVNLMHQARNPHVNQRSKRREIVRLLRQLEVNYLHLGRCTQMLYSLPNFKSGSPVSRLVLYCTALEPWSLGALEPWSPGLSSASRTPDRDDPLSYVADGGNR